MSTKRFQVALSFPGEQRAYVAQVANVLAERLGKEQVFYDQWYTAELARLNLDTYLQAVYHDGAELIVPFLCADYERKKWCGLEWRAIRDLFEKRADADIMPLRFDDTAIPGLFRLDGYIDLRQHTPEQTAAFILQRVKPRQQNTAPLIHSDRLPTVKGGFFGRIAELQLLNDAWVNTTTRIIQFIAPGGTGKTKLLRHWLDHTADIPVLIAWSFYSQGSSEDKQTSATPFFSHAFAKLGSSRERFASEEDKGDHLAELLHGKRYVLVLDGLEPLQHGGAAMRGTLKDKAIRQLLRQLARHPCGLCIITTRIALHELSDRDAPTVIRHDLQNLTAADGIQLLQSLGVTGSAAELGKAVGEYGGHALALSLLGNAVRRYLGGDILRRDTIRELNDRSGQLEHHTFKVMRAYETWLAGTAELELLYLLGLFDHPMGKDVLAALVREESFWQSLARARRSAGYQNMGLSWWQRLKKSLQRGNALSNGLDEFAKLTKNIREAGERHLQQIMKQLQELGLLSEYGNDPNQLDCHPLIREYFGKQLQTQHPDAWQQAHARLYEYYKALPEKELPDTLEEMQPLFSAVAHGCAAGLHQQALDEVYWPRIRRKSEAYIVHKLGAFSDDLATVAHFFTTPWQIPTAGLIEHWKAGVLNWAGFHLRALGRLREAVGSMQASIDLYAKHEDWKQAGINASNLSELQLTIGDLAAAVSSAVQSVAYADKSGELFERMVNRTAHADALHQAGQAALARELFQAAEALQQEWQPDYPHLYSLPGFHYCDLLLARGETMAVLERAVYALKVAKDNGQLLSIALDQLSLGRAHLQQLLLPSTSGRGVGGEGLHWLDQAVAGLRASGHQWMLPLGLLARAALHRHTRDFARARQDLQEVFDIADGSGMRLHLTDYHLEMARVLLAEMETPPIFPLSDEEQEAKPGQAPSLTREGGSTIKEHIEKAAKLIAETGYHRRDKELAELQQWVA